MSGRRSYLSDDRADIAGRQHLIRRAALALAAGAAPLVAIGCGGVLGPAVSPTVSALVPVSCAIDDANIENTNYVQAESDWLNGFSFTGNPKDDLMRAVNRRRVFTQRIAELTEARHTVAGLRPKTDFEKALVRAARADIRALAPEMRYGLTYAPNDKNAPTGPDNPANNLSSEVATSSAQIKKAFSACKTPADLVRRQQAYGG